MEQLAQVALGAVFGTWGEPTSEILNMTGWFHGLSEFLSRIASGKQKHGKHSPESRDVARSLLRSPGWIQLLISAAESLLTSCRTERETSIKLVAFGMRRCSEFLAKGNLHPTPFLGLSDPEILLPMMRNEEELGCEMGTHGWVFDFFNLPIYQNRVGTPPIRARDSHWLRNGYPWVGNCYLQPTHGYTHPVGIQPTHWVCSQPKRNAYMH
jgi:hypothetical protein